MGTLNGSKLTINKSGIFIIKVQTAANGIYLPAEATATLTVEKAEPQITIPGPYSIPVGNPIGSIKLPEGFVWEDDTITNGLNYSYDFRAIYTPEDTVNYTTVQALIHVDFVDYPKTVMDIDVMADMPVKVDGEWKATAIKVDFLPEDELPADDVAKIWQFSSSLEKKIGISYMDISVTQTINNEPISIHELDEPISLQFDTKGKKVLGVVAVHNGELMAFEKTDGGKEPCTYQLAGNILTLQADKYSTYAIIYEVEQTSGGSDSPQTGDNSNMALWFSLLLLSGGAVFTLTVYDRKRKTL